MRLNVLPWGAAAFGRQERGAPQKVERGAQAVVVNLMCPLSFAAGNVGGETGLKLPNKEQEAAAAISELDNPSLNFPFRLPSLEEKVVDAELTVLVTMLCMTST